MYYNNDKCLNIILNSLFEAYLKNVADVAKITNELVARGVIAEQTQIENDHIAFRTLGVPNLGIASFEKIFLANGYIKMEGFDFPEKKLNAFWYAPPSSEYPRIFISELRVNELSDESQKIIHRYTKTIIEDPTLTLDLTDGEAVSRFLHTPLWEKPSKKEFEVLLSESEFAAWVIFNRYYLNHYTISVHNLPVKYNTLPEFNAFLKEIGVKLNNSGGEIKVSADGLLHQSSSVSALKEVEFSCGSKMKIAGSYVEFAERRVLPQFAHLPLSEITSKHRKEGFEAKNADKIFESTYTKQILG